MATTEPDRKTVEWPIASQEAVTKALWAAQDDLYAMRGGQPDPRRAREALAAEVARMRLTAAPLLRATGDPQLARAVFAFAHGMVLLELTHRLPAGADPKAAWQGGIAAFQARATATTGRR
jgi:hypothetical protein